MTNIEYILYKLNKYNTKLEQNSNNEIYKLKQKYYLDEYEQIGGMGCPICRDTSKEILERNKIQLLLNCGHSICNECYESVAIRENVCPTCRVLISTKKNI